MFRKPNTSIRIGMVSLANASFNINVKETYRQSGSVCSLRYCKENYDSRGFHLISWTSHKQKIVSYSTHRAEILACATTKDRDFSLIQGISTIILEKSCKHNLRVDFKALYNTITTSHEGREYWLKQTVQQLKNVFESGELERIGWVHIRAKISYALTINISKLHKLIERYQDKRIFSAA